MDIEELINKANKGDVVAQNKLGMCYYNGDGVEQSYEEAVKWFEKAAEQRHAVARLYLGMCYYYGKGVEQSYKEAAKWIEMAANQGDAKAQYNLGRLYFVGQGVEQSYEKAAKWIGMAANQGDAQAQYNLGTLYYEGQGVEQSYEKAVEWFEKAAEKEYAIAKSDLGMCYLNGTGKERNFKEAERFFKEAVKNGVEEDKYNTKIFEQLQGKNIQQINDISEEVDEENVGAVLISPQENKYRYSHTLYDIKTYQKIKDEVNKILEDIEEVNPNKDNEFDVFMKIFTKLGRMISYDYQAADKDDYKAFNLIGGLLEGKCVCAGYAEILRNVLACRGIECICVHSNNHAFNQVKIGGKWYYCDLTNSKNSLASGQDIEYCLLSKEEFEDKPHRIANKHQVVYPSHESYPQEKVNDAVKKLISSEKNNLHERTEEDIIRILKEILGEFAYNNAIITDFQRFTGDFEKDNKASPKEATKEKSEEQL